MAENTIDNLSIEVTTSADRAARVFDRLASGMGRVRNAASGADGELENAAQGAQDMGMATQKAGTQAGEASKSLNGFGKDAKDAGDKAKKGSSGLANFWQSLKRIAYYRFIRNIIRRIGEAFNYGITNLYQWSSAVDGKFAASMNTIATATNYLKNSLGAMVSPLINALAPALDFIIDKVVDILNWFNQLFAVLSGADTYTVAKKIASTWADAGKSAVSSAKKAADDIKRTILGFDEINKLADNKNNKSGYSSGYSQPSAAGSVLFEEKELSGGFKGFSNAIENALSNTLSRIGLIISGASLAVGAVLTFSGANVPLGLSMMAAGASGLVSIIGMNWNGLSANIKLAIGAVETVVGGYLLATGGILAFSGANVPLGIAMMAAGAVGIASAVGLNWNLLRGKVSASAKGVVGAVSAASVALGAILAFTGANVPLGVGLMAAGITGAAATLKWDWLKNKLRGRIAVITGIVSGGLLALGAILAFSGVALPLGLGMMAVGAVGLASTATANWDIIANRLRGKLGVVTALISGASLVLGILALVGGNIPLGIGLILAGATGLVSTVAANWDNMKALGATAVAKVKEGWNSVTDKVVEFVAKVRNDATMWWGSVQAWWHSTTVGKSVEGFITNVKNRASTWWGNVQSWWHKTISGKSVEDFIVKVADTANDWWADVQNYWTNATKNLSLGTAVKFIVNVLVNIAGKVWDGVTRLWDLLWGTDAQHEERTRTVTANLNLKPGVGFDDFNVASDPTQWHLDWRVQQSMNNNPLEVPVDTDPYWEKSSNGIYGYLGIDDLATTVKIKTQTAWDYFGKTIKQFLGLDDLSTTVKVKLKATGKGVELQQTTGGSGGGWKLVTRAAGGAIDRLGRVSNFANGGIINAYAGGTTNAHGTMFLAGENGPEIMGHVGGRTEILNRSQLAATMYSAVRNAMSGITIDANFNNVNSTPSADSMETLAEMVRLGVEQAMARQNELDRQRNEYLRQINEKDWDVDISTASINRAQTRTNRRAGITIAPVGG